MKIKLQINGNQGNYEVAPNQTLLNFLRAEGFHGPKSGCSNGDCGACEVLLDGKPVNSCLVLAAHCDGASILTIEGLGNPDCMHPVQEAFLDVAAAQCGYCTPGLILSAYALLQENPEPNETEIREALAGNLCRCTGYVKPVEAVKKAAQLMKKKSAAVNDSE
jgi:aerobic-type carbon monoxide dehydrogenase small subunit (CoxS/CutS family)